MTALVATEAKPLQLRFELKLPTSRPLVPLKAAMVVLDRSEDDVRYLCEAGLLEFAFDLRGVNDKGKAADRADLRVYRGSIIRYLEGDYAKLDGCNYSTKESIRTYQARLETVITACLPAGSKPIRVAELVRLWSASSTHLHNLLAANLFAPVPGQKLKAKESPLLARESVVEFLKERRSFK